MRYFPNRYFDKFRQLSATPFKTKEGESYAEGFVDPQLRHKTMSKPKKGKKASKTPNIMKLAKEIYAKEKAEKQRLKDTKDDDDGDTSDSSEESLTTGVQNAMNESVLRKCLQV